MTFVTGCATCSEDSHGLATLGEEYQQELVAARMADDYLALLTG